MRRKMHTRLDALPSGYFDPSYCVNDRSDNLLVQTP